MIAYHWLEERDPPPGLIQRMDGEPRAADNVAFAAVIFLYATLIVAAVITLWRHR